MNTLDVHYSLSQEHDWKIKLMLLMQYVIQEEEEEAVISLFKVPQFHCLLHFVVSCVLPFTACTCQRLCGWLIC